MNALVWKEWRENRLYLAIFVVWMLGAVIYGIAYQWGYQFRAPIGQFSTWASLYTIVAALILAVRLSQGERAAGTLGFSATLPVSLRQSALVKLAAAIVTLTIPVLLASALLVVAFMLGLVEQAEPRSPPVLERLVERPTTTLPIALEHLASVTAIAIFGGVQLLLVVSAIGCWLRSQAHVGFLGAVIAALSFAVSGVLWYGGQPNANWQLAYGALFPPSLVIHWGFGAIGGGSYTDHELALHRWWALLLAAPGLMVLAWLYITQYGRRLQPAVADKPKRGWLTMPAIWSHLPLRMPGRLGAMIWLELRRSLPLATFGLLFALVITCLTAVVEPQVGGGFGTEVRASLPLTIAFLGILWAAVVGAGLYSADLGDGLGAFWRSRPISPGMWFWCKFVVGLIAVLVVLDGATILVSWTASRDSLTTGMSWSYIACFPILHAFLYSLAVLGTCWLRKPALGGLLAFLGFSLLLTAVETFPATSFLEPISVFNQLLSTERSAAVDLTDHGYPLVYGTLAAATCFMAWVASRLAIPLEPARRWFALRAV